MAPNFSFGRVASMGRVDRSRGAKRSSVAETVTYMVSRPLQTDVCAGCQMAMSFKEQQRACRTEDNKRYHHAVDSPYCYQKYLSR